VSGLDPLHLATSEGLHKPPEDTDEDDQDQDDEHDRGHADDRAQSGP
jgi:hypothetical protein